MSFTKDELADALKEEIRREYFMSQFERDLEEMRDLEVDTDE